MFRIGKALTLGLLTGISGLILSFFPFMIMAEENIGLHLLYRLRGVKHAPSEVVIVAIDRESAKQLHLPAASRKWPRSLHARLIEILKDEGAAVISFSLIFHEARSAVDDTKFREAVSKARNVVMVQSIDRRTLPILNNNTPMALLEIDKAVNPIPSIERAAFALAPFPLPKVSTKLNQYWTFKTDPFGGWATLPVVVFQIYAQDVYDEFIQLLSKVCSTTVVEKLPKNKRELLAVGDLQETVQSIRRIFRNEPGVSERMLEVLQKGMRPTVNAEKCRILESLIKMYRTPDSQYLNLYGPPKTITTVSYTQVLEHGKNSPDSRSLPDFKGKAVFVGQTESDWSKANDGFYTVFTEMDGMELSSTEIAATAFANLLEDTPVQPLRPSAYLTTIFLWGMAAGIFGRLISDVIVTRLMNTGLTRFNRRRYLEVISTAMVMFGLAALYLGVAQYQFETRGVWYPVTTTLGAQVPIAFFSSVLLEFFDLLNILNPTEVAKQFFCRAGFETVNHLSSKMLLLYSKDIPETGIATLWQEGPSEGPENFSDIILNHKKLDETEIKLYIIYRKQAPSSETIQSLRNILHCEIIPLFLPMLVKSLSNDDCERQLKELEEPYIVRIDPYAESKPIQDPTWFYGRDELLNRLPVILAQGQHVGIFGLRKVGKTSLTNQLRQHFAAAPTVFIDCQGIAAVSEVFFEEIINQLHEELRSLGFRNLPRMQKIVNTEDFRVQFLTLFDLWEKSEKRVPFLIILDEIDKFFPKREVRNSEDILAEYVRFFRVLRGLAQSRQCLVTMVIAYRPDVNRYNLLTPSVGENPMFQSLQEEYLGFLSPADSETMIREIGLWKQIVWDADAARRGFHYCGGHPLITRFFASHVCQEGNLKVIDYARVEESARNIQSTFRKNEIGNYYKEGIWGLLRDDEKKVLVLICRGGTKGVSEVEIPEELENALTNLEHFGLVTNNRDSLQISAYLFYSWLQRRIG